MKVAARSSFIPVTPIFPNEVQPMLKFLIFCSCNQTEISLMLSMKYFMEVPCQMILTFFFEKSWFALDASCHMTKYLFFQWIHCVHIEIGWLAQFGWVIAVINVESASTTMCQPRSSKDDDAVNVLEVAHQHWHMNTVLLWIHRRCIHTISIYSAILLFIQPSCYWFEGKIRDKCHLLASHNLHLGFPVSVPPAMPSPWGEALPLPSFVLTIISICQAQIDGAFLNAMHDSEYSLLSLFWPWGAGIVWWDCNHLYNQRAAPSESFLTVAQSSCLEQQTAKLLQRGILEREQQNYCWEQTKGISLCLTTF